MCSYFPNIVISLLILLPFYWAPNTFERKLFFKGIGVSILLGMLLFSLNLSYCDHFPILDSAVEGALFGLIIFLLFFMAKFLCKKYSSEKTYCG